MNDLTFYKYDVLHTKKEELSHLERMKIAHDIAQAMAFLHGSDVIHRDLKSKVRKGERGKREGRGRRGGGGEREIKRTYKSYRTYY